MITKRGIVILGFALAFIIAVVMVFNYRQSPGYTITKVDKDTGETIYVQPNKQPERYGETSSLGFLGLPQLLENGLTQTQLELFKTTLITFNKDKQQNKLKVIKVLSAELDAANHRMTGKLKFDENEQQYSYVIFLKSYTTITTTIKSDSETIFTSGEVSDTTPATIDPSGDEDSPNE